MSLPFIIIRNDFTSGCIRRSNRLHRKNETMIVEPLARHAEQAGLLLQKTVAIGMKIMPHAYLIVSD